MPRSPTRTGWSLVVTDPGQAQEAIAHPGDALDLRAAAELDDGWRALGFTTLAPGELVRPLRVASATVADTEALGARLAGFLRPGDLLVLAGPLGAGKTALTRGIGRGLGVQGAVTSPTFVLARRHRGPLPLVHVDAYRLREATGGVHLDDLDLDTGDAVTVVEWGAGVVEGLSDARLEISLERSLGGGGGTTESGDDPRFVQVGAHGRRWVVVQPP